MAVNSMTVSELKNYLAERGISTSHKTKEALVKLSEVADELNLPKIEKDDYQETSLSRRTVTDKHGEPMVLPDVFSIPAPMWLSNLSMLPDIEFGDILVYLATECGWYQDRIRHFKDDNAYKLFQQNHINNVVYHQLHQMQDDYVFVKAKCIPETRQSGDPYDCWILMEKKGYIKSGGCTCVADDGSCKHCVALLFAVNSFCERHRDRGTEVGTDVQCKWDKPRQPSLPSTVIGLQYRQKASQCDQFNPLSSKPCLNTFSIKERLYRVCEDHGSVILHSREPSHVHVTNDESTDEVQDKFPSMPQILTKYFANEQNRQKSDDCLLNHLQDVHTTELVDYIQTESSDESKRDLWFNYRKGRITASLMGSVVRCRLDRLKPDNYIVRQIMGVSSSYNLDATEYGKTMEKVAFTQYTMQYEKNHQKSEITKCGLFISRNHPFIGATPDGLVECECCGEGIIEVKCSFAYQFLTPAEVAGIQNYNLILEDGQIKLKKSCKWYTQIQTQMGVTGKPWCDFVFFTRKGLSVDRIAFDSVYYHDCVQKATAFFTKFLRFPAV